MLHGTQYVCPLLSNHVLSRQSQRFQPFHLLSWRLRMPSDRKPSRKMRATWLTAWQVQDSSDSSSNIWEFRCATEAPAAAPQRKRRTADLRPGVWTMVTMVTSTIPISPKPPNLEIVEQNHLVDTNLQIHRAFLFLRFLLREVLLHNVYQTSSKNQGSQLASVKSLRKRAGPGWRSLVRNHSWPPVSREFLRLEKFVN